MKLLISIATISLLGACQVQDPAYIMQPVEECGYVDEHVYGLVNRPTNDEEIVIGALVGGVIGKELIGNNGGAILGALVGGGIAQQNRVVERAVVSRNPVWRCKTVYR